MSIFGEAPEGRWSIIEENSRYAVSDDGLIIVRNTQELRATNTNQNGARMVTLQTEGGRVTLSVAGLVARAFVENTLGEYGETPIHLDGDRSNCHYTNLMWRPRWFAVQYHKQFGPKRGNVQTLLSVPVYIVETDEVFENSWDAAVKYGLLNHQIVEALANGSAVFPFKYTFQYAETGY